MRPNLSEVLKLVSDNTLAREKMNWSPKVALDDGLRRPSSSSGPIQACSGAMGTSGDIPGLPTPQGPPWPNI